MYFRQTDLRQAVATCIVHANRQLQLSKPTEGEPGEHALAILSFLLRAARHAGQLLSNDEETTLAELVRSRNKPDSLRLMGPRAGKGPIWHLDLALKAAAEQQASWTSPENKPKIGRIKRQLGLHAHNFAEAPSERSGLKRWRLELFASAAEIDQSIAREDSAAGTARLRFYLDHAQLAVAQSESFGMKEFVLRQILERTSRRLSTVVDPDVAVSPADLCLRLLVGLETTEKDRRTMQAASAEDTADALLGTGVCALNAMARAGAAMSVEEPRAIRGLIRLVDLDLSACVDARWTTNRWYLMLLDSLLDVHFDELTPSAPDEEGAGWSPVGPVP